MINLNKPITYIKGVTINRSSLLYQELRIKTCADLLYLFPFRYIDKTQFYKINQLQNSGSEVQIVGKITHLKTIKQQRGSRVVATFIDETGSMELVWFKGVKWIKESLKINTPYIIYGKLNNFNNSFSMPHPEIELLSEYKKKVQTAMQPVYPSTETLGSKNISNKVVRTLIQNLFVEIDGRINESLSEQFVKQYNLMSKKEALLNIHFPKSQENLAKAQYLSLIHI